jgi:1,4-dihydroxy-2-naphthoate octaprenyltransferase
MKNVKLLVRATRAPFLTATVVPVLLGSALAWRDGHFHFGYFLLTFLGAMAFHAATNVINDYGDHKSGNDDINQELTPFSGGSRMIQEQLLSPRQTLRLALIYYAIGIVIGLYLALVRGLPVLWIGLIGFLMSALYTVPRVGLAYLGHGLGELAVGLGFGPVMVGGAYYVQAQNFAPQMWYASIPVGLLITAVIYINEFPDRTADKAADKRTLVVKLGRRGAVPGYIALMLGTYLSIALGVSLGLLPWPTLIAFLTLPLAMRGIQGLCRFFDQTPQLIPSNAMTIQVHLLTGLLLVAAVVVDGVLFG